ncbi:MAG: ATP-binding protein, partial [Candidatus Deferrimicrobiaceae bacterium]
RYIMINQQYAKACGRVVDQVVGLTDLDIWPRELAEKYRADDAEVMETRRGKGVEEIVAETGGAIWVETFKAPIFNLRMEVTGTTGLARDITERKRAEEEKRILEERLNRAEKMEALGILAGGVAHDLNNVLGVIIGYAELVLQKEDTSSAIRPQLEAMMKGGQRAGAIVQDLLTLARRGVLGRDVVNLNGIIADLPKLPEFHGLSSYHPSVQIKHDLEPDLPNISGSSVHLGKTLFNLVSNGCEAMPNSGILTIRTVSQYLDKPIEGYDEVRKGDYVVLSVSDTGGGISEADLKRIFEPFYTKKVMGRSGTGLGLAVVWGTVKDHDGYINVQSEEGKGSTFTLYFPVTREEITAEHESVPLSQYMGKGESILIVDDVEEQRDLATAMLTILNYRISSVASGEEAVMYLKSHPCDLLILDMIMDPGMDGLDTYKRVLEIFPKQKAIIVSGFSESDRVHAAQALGAGAYVRKPYFIEKLGLAVRKELDRTR